MPQRLPLLVGMVFTSFLFFPSSPLLAEAEKAMGAVVVYHDQLDSPSASNTQVWSEQATITAPGNGKIIRGPFQPQPVVLSLPNLPDHGWVKLRFKLSIIGSWDGSNRVWGPDLWSLQVRGGQRLYFATFGNLGNFINNNVQSYPDEYPWGHHPAWTGAEAKDVLNLPSNGGYSLRSSLLNDSVYSMEAIFPHSSKSLILDFTATYNDPPQERQSWGISDLEVTTMTEPPFVQESAFPKLWQDLACPDPTTANAALWTLVSAGDRAIAFISEKVEGLNSSPQNRATTTTLSIKTTSTSLTFGEALRGIINGFLGQASKPQTATRAFKMQGEAPSFTGYEALRLHRAHRILQILNGNDHGTGFKIDHMIPEYYNDLAPDSQP